MELPEGQPSRHQNGAGGGELPVNRQLLGQDRLDVGREREDPAFVVFRRVCVQAGAAPSPIHVPPFERQDLGGCPLARRKCEPDDVRQLARQLALVLGRLGGFEC